MTHAEACICLYRPVVVVPAFAGGRKCGGACQPAGAGGSALRVQAAVLLFSCLGAAIALWRKEGKAAINEFINRLVRHELEHEGAF